MEKILLFHEEDEKITIKFLKDMDYPFVSVSLPENIEEALHIYEEQSLAPDTEACRGIFDECMKSPLLFEWRMMAIFGHNAEILWKIKVIIIKILRRL